MKTTFKLLNVQESSRGDISAAIQKWGTACEKVVGSNPSVHSKEHLRRIVRTGARAGFLATGLRLHAWEMLSDPSDIFWGDNNGIRFGLWVIPEIARKIASIEEVTSLYESLKDLADPMSECLQFVVANDLAPMSYLAWRLWSGAAATIDVDPTVGELVRPSRRTARAFRRATVNTEHCTDSQRGAVAALGELIEIKRANSTFGSWKPRTSALLVGPSGAGKSFVTKIVAQGAGLSHWSTTTGSWAPRNGHDRSPTTHLLHAHLVQEGPALIVIDEIDKIRGDRDNGNFFATIFDEILCLVDGRMDAWGWKDAALSALHESHFVFAGAFQDLFRKKLGDDVLFAQQVEDLSLSLDEIIAARWLPDELVNRISARCIEIRIPTSAEMENILLQIEEGAGMVTTPEERKKRARASVMSMKGLRSIEEFVLDVARRKLRG